MTATYSAKNSAISLKLALSVIHPKSDISSSAIIINDISIIVFSANQSLINSIFKTNFFYKLFVLILPIFNSRFFYEWSLL